MEKQFVALVIIALVIGLGGGYGLSYVTYQPQILGLHSEMVNLQNKIAWLNTSLYTSTIEITSVNATVLWDSGDFVGVSLNYTIKNNGQHVEFLITDRFFRDNNGTYIDRYQSHQEPNFVLPNQERTEENVLVRIWKGWHIEGFTIELWTYDGDVARAYVEIPRVPQ